MVVTFIFMAALAQGLPSPEALARQAQSDLKLGEYSAACQKLETAIRASPRNPAFWFLLGVGRSELKELNPAIEAFEKVLSIDPQHAPAYFNLGLLYGYKGQEDKALDMYGRGLKIAPDDLGANQNYAFLLMKTRRYREALRPLLQLKAAKGSDLSVRTTLVECYWKTGMKREAEEETTQFLNSPVATEADKLDLAGILIEDGEMNAAQSVLERLVASAPESAEAHGKLGLLLSKKDQFEDAARQLRRAVQLAPDVAEYSIGLAEVLLLSGQSPAALEFLMAVKPRFERLPEFRYKLALAYYGMHQYDQAIEVLEGLAHQHPELDLPQLFLGNCYYAMGDLKDAEPFYRKAIQLNPKRVSNYPPLAQLLRKQGGARTDEAIRYLQTALGLDPSDMQSKLELAVCYVEKQRLRESQVLLEDVTRAQPELVQAHRVLARVYYRLGKKQEGDREKSIVARLEAEGRGKGWQSSPTPQH